MSDKKHWWDFADELPDDPPLPTEVRERYRRAISRLRTVYSDAEIRQLIRRIRRSREKNISAVRRGLTSLDEQRPKRKAPTTPLEKLLQVGFSTPEYDLVAVLDDVRTITEGGIESYLGRNAVEPIHKNVKRRQTKKALDAKGKPAEARRELLKDVARLKGWDSINPVDMSTWKSIRSAFRSTHPKYKKYKNRVHNEDAVIIGLRRRKKSSATKKR